MSSQPIVDRFRSARSDPSLAVLEGIHPLKHAIRFGAELVEVVGLSVKRLVSLADNVAPDIVDVLTSWVSEVPADVFERLTPLPPPTGVIGIARRPIVSLTEVLNNPSPAPLVLLEKPRNLGNIGAVVRVAAAAGVAGVITTGDQDPWHPAALIGGAGLQYALPVTRTATFPASDRPIVAVDPGGEPLGHVSMPKRALLAFGSEREGISRELMELADHCISIPMSDGVSSLNLATAVAVVLYKWKLG